MKNLILSVLLLSICFITHAAELKEDLSEEQQANEFRSISREALGDLEEKYPMQAVGCELFLGISLNDCFHQKTSVDDQKLIPVQSFTTTMNSIQNEIEDAKYAYLADLVSARTNVDSLQEDNRFSYIREFPPKELIYADQKLLLLESLENNSDVIVNLLLQNDDQNIDIHNLDWNAELPVLAQGCNFLNINFNNFVQNSLGVINQHQLNDATFASTTFHNLRDAVTTIETDIVTVLYANISNIRTEITHAANYNRAINVSTIPMLSYLLQNEKLNFIDTSFKRTIESINIALLDAIKNNKINCVESLIQAHINVNCVSTIIPPLIYAVLTITPLIYAVLKSRSEIVQILINAHADLNIIDSTFGTALQLASTKNYIGIVKLLINAGADINIAGAYGLTALISAAYNNRYTIVNLLIDAGADLNIRDNEGKTALGEAIKNFNDATKSADERANAQAIVTLLADKAMQAID